MENFKIENKNEVSNGTIIDKDGQTKLDFDSIQEKQIIKIEENNDISKNAEILEQIGFGDLSEENIEKLKTDNPDTYYEMLEKMTNLEIEENNKKMMSFHKEDKPIEEDNKLKDFDKEDPAWEYYGRFKK